jgi:hypothetical protein
VPFDLLPQLRGQRVTENGTVTHSSRYLATASLAHDWVRKQPPRRQAALSDGSVTTDSPPMSAWSFVTVSRA